MTAAFYSTRWKTGHEGSQITFSATQVYAVSMLPSFDRVRNIIKPAQLFYTFILISWKLHVSTYTLQLNLWATQEGCVKNILQNIIKEEL